MKKFLAFVLALAMVLALAACGGNSGAGNNSGNAGNGGDAAGSNDAGSTGGKTVTVGATPAPHAAILEVAKKLMEADGYTLDIKEFDDYVTPNTSLEDGSLDANYFQHVTYMNDFND